MARTNSVRLIGRFGQDPKSHVTDSGKLIVSFSFATHEKRKDDAGNWQPHTEWHNIVSFGHDAQNIQKFMRKGSEAMIEGRLQTRQYVDKSNNSRFVTEIICEDILFLGSANENQGSTNQE